MPLLGKIVVIKRNGGDGTEFPLTASCLFGRKLDCDIRIQLPQVSKEHCKIELNENKELIVTNLSSVNPTRINGQVLNQSERLKHGDLITIIDRSFRFEYPPPKTPKKKRLSTAGKDKTVQALQEQQEKSTPVPVEKRKSEHSYDTCLKDGSNLPPSVQQTVEADPEDGKRKDNMSPFCQLYQMVKQDLVAKSPWKSDVPKTPLARPQTDQEDVSAADVKSTSKQVTAPSTKKRRSSKSHSEDATKPSTPQKSCNANLEEKPADDDESMTPSLTENSATPVPQRKRTPSKTPQKFSAGEVVQQILLEPHSEGKTPKSPKERRSGASQDQSLALQKPAGQPQTPGSTSKNTEVKMSPRTSPRSNAGKRFQVQEVVDEIKATTSASKKKAGTSVDKPQDGKESHTKGTASRRKRVSFGGQLSPELFDKRLPPNSPLRRGATPRHSLGPFQKPQSLLRRASTIGLLALRLEEAVLEAQKKASPKRAASFLKTPSPAKRSPNTKAKTPSPKSQKSPSAPTNASKPSSPATPKTTRRASTSAIETPKVQGRFSISRVSTPSPVQDQGEQPEVASATAEDMPQKCVTPKIPLKRKSMKVSARKTPKSAIKSAFDVMRSRRSGASCANLKVLTSWADIVKFGQTKPQTEVTTKKKSAKSILVKKTAVPKPKTPMRRLKDDISTGHAASPLTIVVGKAHMRANQPVGAAPKIMPNVALFKKDMKMDEDFTGVADIFKTPANSKSKNIILMNNECPEVPVDEISVMKTPEESGEMIVSPLSVLSTAKCGRYNNEAVTRLLLDNQDDSLLEGEGLAKVPDNSNEAVGHDITDQEIPPVDQTEEEEAVPETPKQKTAPSLCLTGVKRLMKTPKQRAEPIEDLRGKLLKTPKDKKPPQEESLEGIKELLKTPKCEEAQVEDIVGVKRVIQTQNEKSSPLLCAGGLQGLMKTPKEKSVENEDLTDVKELMQTPKLKGDLVENQFGLKRLVKTPKQKRQPVEEDLTGVQHLMKTPKHKGEPVEDQMGVKRLMQTPKEKVLPVEDLTGVKQLMQTPKQKGEPVSKPFGISKMMKTPRFRGVMAEEDFTGLKELVEEPANNSTPTAEKSVTDPFEIQEPVLAVESDSFIPAEDLNEECDKENVCPVETKEADVLTPVDLQCTSEAADSNQSDLEIESAITQEKQPEQIEDKPVSVEAIDCSSRKDENIIVQSEESVCTPETDTTVKTTPTSSTAEQEEDNFIIKYDNEMAKAPSALSLIEEESMNGPLPSSPLRGRRGKKVLEVPEVTASPVRKSARGRIPKRTDADDEASQMSMKTKISDCLPVVTKTRKGRKAKVDLSSGETHCPDATEEPAQTPVVKSGMNETENKTSKNDAPIEHDVNAGVPQCPSAPTGEEPVQTPVVRSGRRKKMDKPESKTSEDDATVEPIHDVNAGVPQGPGAPTAEEPVQAPVVRSGRRKMDKTESKTSEDDATVEPIHDVNAGVPQCLDVPAADEPIQAPVVRSGRRKKIDKTESKTSENDTSIEPDHDINAGVPQCTDEPAKEELVQATVVKPGRRKKMVKSESQPSGELEQKTSDMICEENAVVPDVKMQTSQGTESISSTRARRGKPSKKEHLKTEPSQILESETPVVVVAEKPATSVLKSGRGRNSKQETIKDQSLDYVVSSQTVAEANVEHKEPQTPVVKSGRGRKAKQQKPQLAEEIVTEEYTETVVKPLRGNRKTKQSKVTVSTEVEENVVAETPVVKSGRKRAVISQETECSVKRGRRAVAVPARSVSVVSSRGCKAESEVAEDVASSEEPVKPVKNTRRTAKVTVSKKVENLTTQAGSEFISTENTAVVTLEKAERGSRTKKQKNSTKDIPVNESATDEEVGKVKPSKTVNWNPDLVASQVLELSADVEEPQLKKSKRLEKLPAETSTRESNQSTDLPPRGRRGRGAAKQEKELPVEDTQEEAQINVKPLRRGKAVVSATPKSQPGDNKPSTPLKRKRNEVLEVAEPVKEPLPKRRGRVANSAEAAEEVPSKDKIPEAEPEKVIPKRTGRGQKKTAQEPDPVPAQEPVSGTTTRKGRGVKKVEEVDVPAEAAPVRRTRRK